MDFRESLQDDINKVSRFPDVRGAQNILAALEKIKSGVNMPNSTNLEENDGFYFSKEARDLFMAAHKELKGTKVFEEGEVPLEVKVRRSIETFKNAHKEAPSSEKYCLVRRGLLNFLNRICVICMEEYKFGNMNM